MSSPKKKDEKVEVQIFFFPSKSFSKICNFFFSSPHSQIPLTCIVVVVVRWTHWLKLLIATSIPIDSQRRGKYDYWFCINPYLSFLPFFLLLFFSFFSLLPQFICIWCEEAFVMQRFLSLLLIQQKLSKSFVFFFFVNDRHQFGRKRKETLVIVVATQLQCCCDLFLLLSFAVVHISSF